jgi:hypothetical protein
MNSSYRIWVLLLAILSLCCQLAVINGATTTSTVSSSSSSSSIYQDCPIGSYRENQYKRECKLCPRGYYGNTVGLTSSTCSGPCPIGRYSDKVGTKYEEDCELVSSINVCMLIMNLDDDYYDLYCVMDINL